MQGPRQCYAPKVSLAASAEKSRWRGASGAPSVPAEVMKGARDGMAGLRTAFQLGGGITAEQSRRGLSRPVFRSSVDCALTPESPSPRGRGRTAFALLWRPTGTAAGGRSQASVDRHKPVSDRRAGPPTGAERATAATCADRIQGQLQTRAVLAAAASAPPESNLTHIQQLPDAGLSTDSERARRRAVTPVVAMFVGTRRAHPAPRSAASRSRRAASAPAACGRLERPCKVARSIRASVQMPFAAVPCDVMSAASEPGHSG